MEKYRPTWTYLLGLVLFFVGIRVGIGFADIDQKISRSISFTNGYYLFTHRSIITHGCLLPLLLFSLVEKYSHPVPRLFAIGFFLASTIHLCFDLFPRGWYGFSFIKIPFYGSTDTLFSWLWMAGSCVICLYLTLLLIKYVFEILLSCIGLATTFALESAGEQKIGASLFMLLVFIVIAVALPSRTGSIIRQWKMT